MADTGKPTSDQFKDTPDDKNKPDFRNLNLGSPVSPLTNHKTGSNPSSLTTTTTSSSSSSSGSFSCRNPTNPPSKSNSGELAGSSHSSPRTRPNHRRSDSCGSTQSTPSKHIYSGGSGSSVNSPPTKILPMGNICPMGRVKTGMASARPTTRSDVLGSGTGNYGHGSIMRGTGSPSGNTGSSNSGHPIKKTMESSNPDELQRIGCDHFFKGHYEEALSLFDRAIKLSPRNAALLRNRAATLTNLGRVSEAIRGCEDAIKLDPSDGKLHELLGYLLIRLGQVDAARKHLFFKGQQPTAAELGMLQAVEKHLNRCTDARRIGDWKSTLREADAAIAAGADYSPQLFSCRAEYFLKMQQLDGIDRIMSKIPKVEPSPSCCSQSKFFGMLSEAYILYVRAQIDMALGRFEDAIAYAEKAVNIDPKSVEVAKLLTNARRVARARARGNDLYNSERFTEACAAYEEGLKLDPSSSVLYCNRAACWFKLGMWEKTIEDCNTALHIHSNYTKALLRRAAANSKLQRWADAVRDYEILKKELPHDDVVAESLFHAKVSLKKSRGEEVSNMTFGGDVEEITRPSQFRAIISSSGVSVVHFFIPSNPQCKRISSSLDMLCGQYPSINFLKVNLEESTEVSDAENVRIVPTIKIYKNGSRVKEIVNPTSDVLEASVRHYSL